VAFEYDEGAKRAIFSEGDYTIPAPKIDGQLRPQDREMRSQAMLMRRLQGDSIRQIQERFNVSRATVGRNLEKARKKAYLQLGQELIVTELFPSAIGAVKAAIEQGELDLAANTALRLLEGMHILGRHAQGPASSDGWKWLPMTLTT
jgi:hypothetical protein